MNTDLTLLIIYKWIENEFIPSEHKSHDIPFLPLHNLQKYNIECKVLIHFPLFKHFAFLDK